MYHLPTEITNGEGCGEVSVSVTRWYCVETATDTTILAIEGESYTVPILKNKNSIHCKSITVDDFRGISISAAISKVFEHCI